jgi:GAF domain-containing protein
MTAQAILRLLRPASRSGERTAAEAADQAGSPLPALRQSGYLGIVLERLVLHASTIFGADEVCVFGRDRRGRDEALVLIQGAGVDPELIGRPLTIEWDPMVAALACGRPLAIRGELWPAWQGEHDRGEPVQSAAIAPVWFAGRMQGAVSVIHRREEDPPGVPALALLGELAELTGRVLAHTDRRLLSAADPQPELDALLATRRRLDGNANGHAPDVAAVARRLGEDLGLGGADLIEIELGAQLHDIGKLRVPFQILRKTSPLTSAELELLRLQQVWAAEMIARIPGLEAISLIVRHCHERWDGLGYPDGLEGERIPLASRIVALAEALCSATSLHPTEVGTRFDPRLAARIECHAVTA